MCLNLLREMAGAAWYAIFRSKDVRRQHGNGIVDSLPVESGNPNVQLGRQRLLFTHPLRALELSQRAVEGSLEGTLIAKQSIQPRRIGNALPEDFNLPSFGLDLLITYEIINFRGHLSQQFRLAFFGCCISILLSLNGRLYCTPKAIWKLRWCLRDFGYDPDLLG